MPEIPIQFPVYVSSRGEAPSRQYKLQPLLYGHPVVYNARYRTALEQMQVQLREMLTAQKVTKENIGVYLHYTFAPQTALSRFRFNFQLGNTYIQGLFNLVTFEMKGCVYCCLPDLHQFQFILSDEERNQTDLKEAVLKRVKSWIKLAKKSLGNDFDPEQFYSPEVAFMTQLQFKLFVPQGGFSFESSDEQSWMKLVQNDEFDGATELQKVGNNWNDRYPHALRQAYYRAHQKRELNRLLFEGDRTPLAIIGEEGVGRATLLESVFRDYIEAFSSMTVSQQVAEEEVEEIAEDHLDVQELNLDEEDRTMAWKDETPQPVPIWSVDPNRIIAGMSYVGWWQKRSEAIFNYLAGERHDRKNEEPGILIFEQAIALFSIGKSASNNLVLSQVLRPYLERKSFQCILLLTPEEWRVVEEKDRRFGELFHVLRVSPPDMELATRMVLKQRRVLEQHHGCAIQIQAISQLIYLYRNYLRDQALPGAIMRQMNQLANKYPGQIIDAEEVRVTFQEFSGLNRLVFDPSAILGEEYIENRISSQLIGQPQAVQALSNLVYTIKGRLQNPKRPAGTFLFIGPTGVGKTEAAKVLAGMLLSSSELLIRFDMNEFSDPYAFHRLIGDENNPDGLLTAAVRQNPFAVILLDEIEKADSRVHDLLLQVLDDGRLTDSRGRTCSFLNTVIVLSSNVGARESQTQLGFEETRPDPEFIYRKALERTFRPEFINRIDEIVVFNHLDQEAILGIARLQIRALLQRDGFLRRLTILNVEKDALAWVAKRGFNHSMGGRALKRQLEKDLTHLSARRLLEIKGGQPIFMRIVLKDNQLKPVIEPLTLVPLLEGEWLPEIPPADRGRRFYQTLLEELSDMELEVRSGLENRYKPESIIINSQRGGSELDWRPYSLHERLAEAKEEITHLSLGFRDQYYAKAPAIPLRLKRVSLSDLRTVGSRAERNTQLYKSIQEQALDTLTDGYERGDEFFDRYQTEVLNSWVKVRILKAQTASFALNQYDQVYLSVRPLVDYHEIGHEEYLLQNYRRLFEYLNWSYEWQEDAKRIAVEGYGIHQVLKHEYGVHLFEDSYRAPMPLYLYNASMEKGDEHQKLRIVRKYSETRLQDLRTGYRNALHIDPAELLVLLSAGLDQEEGIQ